MASQLTVMYTANDYPRVPTLGVLGRTDGTLHLCQSVDLHEPISVSQMAMSAKRIVRLWFEPELVEDADQALAAYISSLGTSNL